MTTFNIYFDGGSHGTHGYGSWEVTWQGFSKKVSREKYFNHAHNLPSITNNSAEYLSLLGALEWLWSVKDKKNYKVKIFGDSQLVLFTLSGRYKTKKAHLKIFRDRCLERLAGYADWETIWQERTANVRRFGH